MKAYNDVRASEANFGNICVKLIYFYKFLVRLYYDLVITLNAYNRNFNLKY